MSISIVTFFLYTHKYFQYIPPTVSIYNVINEIVHIAALKNLLSDYKESCLSCEVHRYTYYMEE